MDIKYVPLLIKSIVIKLYGKELTTIKYNDTKWVDIKKYL